MRNYIHRILQRIGPSELAMLLSLALIVAGIWAFMEIADEVVESESISFDQQVINALHPPDRPGRPVGPPWLRQVAQDITSWGGYTTLILLGGCVLIFFGLKRDFGLMFLTLAAITGGALVSTVLKLLFARNRPAIEHLVHVSTYSFPSGHALLSAVVYLTLGALLARASHQKRFKIFFLSVGGLVAILVGLSRIYLGVHYPTDVLAGWIAGSVWAVCCLLGAAMVQRRRRKPPNAIL